jgi:mono/diheme cytochrome c family protein
MPPVKKVAAIFAIVFAAGAIVAACSNNSNSSTSANNGASATSAGSTAVAMSSTAAPSKSPLPIPLSKLKSVTVAKGDPVAGKAVFDANCESCHGAGARNQGGPGPTLAGTGIKPGQVAFMVLNPAAIDPTSGMPKLTLTNKQIADVSAYVSSLK